MNEVSVSAQSVVAMKRRSRSGVWWRVLLGAALLSHPCPAETAGEDVMKRVVQRGEALARAGKDREYPHEKHSIIEELDTEGKVTRTTDRTYQVLMIDGAPYDRLIRIGNRPLTEQQLMVENRKEQEHRQRRQNTSRPARRKHREITLTADLVGRFAYTLVGHEERQGRPTWVVEFRPRLGGLEKTARDKILSRLAGTLWIDDQEAEVARLKVRLTEDLALGWFGMIGSLTQCDLFIENQRLPDGSWVTAVQTLELRGRKVISTMRSRSREESSNFQPVE